MSTVRLAEDARPPSPRPGGSPAIAPSSLLCSLLFVPGDRADRFDKAAATGAHAVLLDLEDAVAPGNKAAARDSIAAWMVQRAARALGSVPQVIVRINGADTEWHAKDLEFMAQLPAGVGVMLPKSEPASLPAVAAILSRDHAPQDRPLYALIETVAGVLGLRAMAAVPSLHRFAFGNVDFGVDAGITPSEDEIELAAVRTALVLESRGAGLPPPVDGVTLETTDTNRIAAHAARARRFGFGGKLCIHPRQVIEVNAAFGLSEDALAWARGVLAAYEASNGAAVVFEGKMIDRPVAERARRILAQAAATGV
jgi:citrate lyase subunit beta / citryl-CoA lyase